MPRIIFEKALPVGVESLGEFVDMELEEAITPSALREKINQTLPSGIEVIEAKEILVSTPSATLPHRSVYWITLDHLLSKEEVSSRLKKTLGKGELFILQERKGNKRRIDLLPLIEKVEVKENSGDQVAPCLELVLGGRLSGKTAKPLEALEALLGLQGEALSRCKVVKVE